MCVFHFALHRCDAPSDGFGLGKNAGACPGGYIRQASCSQAQDSTVQARAAHASPQNTRLPRRTARSISTVQVQLAQAHFMRREERAADDAVAFFAGAVLLVFFAMTASFRAQYRRATRSRQPHAAAAPRYNRGTRAVLVMPHSTSHAIVPAHSANSAAVIAASACRPLKTTKSPVATRLRAVTSTMI